MTARTIADLGGCVIGRVLSVRHHMESGFEYQFDDVEALVSDSGIGVAGFIARRDTLKAGELCVIIGEGVLLDAKRLCSMDCFIGGFETRNEKTYDGREYKAIYAVTSFATAVPLRDLPEIAERIRFDRKQSRDVWEEVSNITFPLLGKDVTELIGAICPGTEKKQ